MDIWLPSGQTRVAGVIGFPARYSLSPTIHTAAYRAMGLDAVYVAFPVESGRVESAIEAMRSLDIMGYSVTIPHKEAVIPFLDELSSDAQRLHAVNCIQRIDGKLVGHNTDGAGFVSSLRADLDFDVAEKRCVVIGAGGAARSIIGALSGNGAADVCVVNRSADRALDAATHAGDVGRVGSADDIAAADLVVNATPIGMAGHSDGQLPAPVDGIGPHHTVVDIIFHPPITPFLQAAASRGATTANGVGMLIHQAALQIELWTGRTPPIDVMRASVT